MGPFDAPRADDAIAVNEGRPGTSRRTALAGAGLGAVAGFVAGGTSVVLMVLLGEMHRHAMAAAVIGSLCGSYIGWQLGDFAGFLTAGYEKHYVGLAALVCGAGGAFLGHYAGTIGAIVGGATCGVLGFGVAWALLYVAWWDR